MVFAQMVVSDEDAVICDFLQYYHVMDYRELPLQRAAILACGLPAESRSIQKLSGRPCPTSDLYQLSIIDAIRSLQYVYVQAHSKKHIKPPKSLVEALLKKDDETETMGFDSPEEFEAARNRIINNG